jgi:hypothetical protein
MSAQSSPEKKSVVTVRDMVDRFRNQRPMSRTQREQEFGQQGPTFWWKDGNGAGTQAQASVESDNTISSRLLSAHAMEFDGGVMEDLGTEPLAPVETLAPVVPAVVDDVPITSVASLPPLAP